MAQTPQEHAAPPAVRPHDDRVLWIGVVGPAALGITLLNMTAQMPDVDFAFAAVAKYLFMLTWVELLGGAAFLFRANEHRAEMLGRDPKLLEFVAYTLNILALCGLVYTLVLMIGDHEKGSFRFQPKPSHAPKPPIATQPVPPAR